MLYIGNSECFLHLYLKHFDKKTGFPAMPLSKFADFCEQRRFVHPPHPVPAPLKQPKPLNGDHVPGFQSFGRIFLDFSNLPGISPL